MGVAATAPLVCHPSDSSVAEEIEEGIRVTDNCVLQGRLKNSESLANLDQLLGHLPESQKAEMICLIRAYLSLFQDTPSRTT